VEQRGSLVLPERFRFDFSHNKPLTTKELTMVEKHVNQIIDENLQIYDREVSFEIASQITGLRTVPGEVYPDPVRIVSVGKKIEELLKNPKKYRMVKFLT